MTAYKQMLQIGDQTSGGVRLTSCDLALNCDVVLAQSKNSLSHVRGL